MISPVVLLHTDDPATAREVLARDHGDLRLHDCTSYDGLAAAIAESGAEVVYSTKFAGPKGFPRPALLESPSVRWISVGGSGTDHLQPWDPARLTVTNAAGVAADMMAEYAIGTMLHFALNLPLFGRQQKNRQWLFGKVKPIAGSTVLILGLGKTGLATAHRARALGLTTIGVRANPAPAADLDEVHGIDALPQLWGRADYILCCVPLLPTTRGLINAEAFNSMKTSAVLVDVSRGGVVEGAALLQALESGQLAGAALDVFETEPLPPEHPLWAKENVIITPHSSSVFDGWEKAAFEMFAENLTRYRSGQPLQNIVDPQRGY